jgi:asparagine synthase (glutamine-hydrolysing)
MCGIAGIINLNHEKVQEEHLEKMLELIHYRGPDGKGSYFHNNFALGHVRLSILDLSEAGKQPMFWEDKYAIVYNGEIYNYIEIKNELCSLGYTFKTHTDTEVILAAYDKWGEGCVEKFNGMWAFVIHDKSKNILFCSRDRFGVKPFYYFSDKNKFIFGSEIKQILPHLAKNILNKKVLLDYLVMGMEAVSDETFFKDVVCLLPSHNLIFDLTSNSFKIKRYYKIEIDRSVTELNEEESVKLWSKEFQRSIQYRLRSDVKVGTCLSGGLDSSTIAGFASAEYQKASSNKFTAITAVSEDQKNDESSFAQKVVQKANLEWHKIKPDIDDFKKTINEVIKVQEEPFGSPSIVMQYFVMKKAKEIGSTVLLDGQGGDETLLGYERYYPAYLLSLPLIKKIKEFFNSSENSKLTKKQLLLYYIYFTNAKIRIKRQKMKFSFIKKEYLEMINERMIDENSKKYSNIFELQIMELESTQLPHLLKYEDKNSMYFSIETRLPFLDYKLVELSLSINNAYKIKNGWTKYLLRRVAENVLPDDVVWRKNKFGFEAPVNIWLKDKIWLVDEIKKSKIVKELISGEIPENLDNSTLWRLFNIAGWEKQYNVEIN